MEVSDKPLSPALAAVKVTEHVLVHTMYSLTEESVKFHSATHQNLTCLEQVDSRLQKQVLTCVSDSPYLGECCVWRDTLTRGESNILHSHGG